MEEMGLRTNLRHVHSFLYKAQLENNLSEHEFDHVFFGVCNEIPRINKSEVSTWKYIPVAELRSDVQQNGKVYTEWFKICLDSVLNKI
jgi:isopentenyl-diphosphate delta-isomerase